METGMAIQSVTNENLSAYVAERTAKGSKIATGEQMVEAADRINTAKSGDKGPTPGNPVIKAVEETLGTSPDPGKQEPTAARKAEIADAKAGTDPAIQKRIDKAVAAQREAEELFEAEYTERLKEQTRREEAESRLRELEAKTQPKVELVEPNPEDPKYKTVAEYLKDRAAYDAQVTDQKIAKAREEERARIAMEQANAALAVKAQAARKEFDDFDEVIDGAVKAKLTPPDYIQGALRESEVGLHIAYHLAKFPEDRDRIFALPAWKAIREIGRLEDKYLKTPVVDPKVEPPPKPIETTKAPAPVAKLSGGEGTVSVDLSTETNFTRYREARLEQIRKRRRH